MLESAVVLVPVSTRTRAIASDSELDLQVAYTTSRLQLSVLGLLRDQLAPGAG